MTFEHGARDGLAAALVAAGLLWVIARPPAATLPGVCVRPSERLAQDGWTIWVDCGLEQPFRPLRGASPLLFGRPLDLNRAAPRVLEVLPGVGPARASRIERERESEPFAGLGEVARVHGIGPALVAELEGWATACPRRPSGAPHRSQKSFQLLSDP